MESSVVGLKSVIISMVSPGGNLSRAFFDSSAGYGQTFPRVSSCRSADSSIRDRLPLTISM